MSKRFLFVRKDGVDVERIELRPGESADDAAKRWRAQRGLPLSPATATPDPPAKVKASKTAPVGSREWEACLIENFGADQGRRFIALKLSYLDALDEAVRVCKTTAPRGVEEKPAPQPPRGFASRIRIDRGLSVFKKSENKRATA